MCCVPKLELSPCMTSFVLTFRMTDDIQCSLQFQSNSSELDTEVVEVLWSFLNTLTWLMIQMRFSPSFPPGEGSDWCQQISSDKQGGRRAAAKMPGFGIPFITRTMAGNSPHHGHCVQPFLWHISAQSYSQSATVSNDLSHLSLRFLITRILIFISL